MLATFSQKKNQRTQGQTPVGEEDTALDQSTARPPFHSKHGSRSHPGMVIALRLPMTSPPATSFFREVVCLNAPQADPAILLR